MSYIKSIDHKFQWTVRKTPSTESHTYASRKSPRRSAKGGFPEKEIAGAFKAKERMKAKVNVRVKVELVVSGMNPAVFVASDPLQFFSSFRL